MKDANIKNKKATLAYFTALNAILIIIITNFVPSKAWVTILSVLAGPASWGIAWYLERWVILYAPSSLEDAKCKRADDDLIAEVTTALKDPTLTVSVRKKYESMLQNAKTRRLEMLERRSTAAHDNAATAKPTTVLPPSES